MDQAATGGITGAQATGVITVKDITTFGVGASLASDLTASTSTLSLDSTGKVLTIELTAVTGGGAITTPAMAAGTTVTTTVEDAAGNKLVANPAGEPVPTGSF